MERTEDKVVERLRKLLADRGWHTLKTHGNAFQSGVPDLLCWHKTYGHRMVEVKTPRGRLTPHQKREFHMIAAHGGAVYILVGDTPVDDLKLSLEIEKLRGSANWHNFL